jgi:predicted O-methyltransferase YrrM
MVELGTNFGLGTSYLAHASSQPQIITLEGCPETSRIASETFDQLKLKNIKLITGPFDENLPKVVNGLPSVDLVFFDGNHRYEPTLNYFNLFLLKATNQTVFIFHDIHQSQEMERAWQEIIQTQSITLSLDFYRLGVVFFKKELSKQHFILRF